MSIAQIVKGYCFHSTDALTALALAKPEQHAKAALGIIKVKNTAAQASHALLDETHWYANNGLEQAKKEAVSQYTEGRSGARDLAATLTRIDNRQGARVNQLHDKLISSRLSHQKYETQRNTILNVLMEKHYPGAEHPEVLLPFFGK